MANRRGSDESISGMHRAPRILCRGGKFAPETTSLEVNREESLAIVAFEGLEPRFECTFFRDFLQKEYALTNFADGYDAHEEFFFSEGVHGLADPPVSLRVTQF